MIRTDKQRENIIKRIREARVGGKCGKKNAKMLCKRVDDRIKTSMTKRLTGVGFEEKPTVIPSAKPQAKHK